MPTATPIAAIWLITDFWSACFIWNCKYGEPDAGGRAEAAARLSACKHVFGEKYMLI